MKIFYSPAYVAAADAFDTTRKAEWVAVSLRDEPIEDIELYAPQPVSASQLAIVHDVRYINAVRTGLPRFLAESQSLRWDAQLWSAVCASNGGVLAAAHAAMQDGVSGSLSSGLHHARREHGDGFCTFNGLALAARAVLNEGTRGVRQVLILDLDAHCGGGTHSLVASEPRIWQVDVATSTHDVYLPGKHHTLDVVDDAARYLPAIRARLGALERAALCFDLCLYNAGMDPFEGCAVGGLPGITFEILAERESLVFDWCRSRQIPLAFVLAGGYTGAQLDEETLVALHRLTLNAAVSATRTMTVR